jgi:hypothetical protein
MLPVVVRRWLPLLVPLPTRLVAACFDLPGEALLGDATPDWIPVIPELLPLMAVPSSPNEAGPVSTSTPDCMEGTDVGSSPGSPPSRACRAAVKLANPS